MFLNEKKMVLNISVLSTPNDVLVATNYLCRAEMLAYAIPAESYAVGANPLPQLNADNYDMATLFVSGQDDLPPNGDKTTERHKDWQHSTFVQRSYKRAHQLFRTIIQYIKEDSR